MLSLLNKATTWQGRVGVVVSLCPVLQSVPGYRRPRHWSRG